MSGADAVAYRHAVHAAVCDESVPWAHGVAVFARELPTFFAYNAVRVQGRADGLTEDELVVAAERLQGTLGHRAVEVEDVATGERLRAGLAARGWETERLVWMALEGPAQGDGHPAATLEEVPFRDTRPLRADWFESASWADSPATVTAFMRMEEAVAERRGTRGLLARTPAGEPIGFASFSRLEDEAEVEMVEVVAEHRNRGIGGALVRRAVALAGAPLTWIIADDEAPAKRLYARLGFRPAWIQHVFTRPRAG